MSMTPKFISQAPASCWAPNLYIGMSMSNSISNVTGPERKRSLIFPAKPASSLLCLSSWSKHRSPLSVSPHSFGCVNSAVTPVGSAPNISWIKPLFSTSLDKPPPSQTVTIILLVALLYPFPSSLVHSPQSSLIEHLKTEIRYLLPNKTL